METKMSVRDLRISFRTSNGKVQAVRGINFDLAKGETLAIVGESGSGKSVTSKAILGIQAANAITESGEIIYDGKDLLKINEEEFHKIRGDKIAMIFQDPMSSLNPIVKIGKQLTEAMILQGKARQRESKLNFNTYLKALNTAMAAAGGNEAEMNAKCKNFDKFEFKHIEMESAYNTAFDAAKRTIEDINGIAFEMEKKSVKSASDRIGDIATQAKASVNPYVVHTNAQRIKELASSLKGLLRNTKKTKDYSKILAALYEIRDILTKAVAKDKPDFFAMGYYLTFVNATMPEFKVGEMNAQLKERLDKDFLNDFLVDTKKALQYTASQSYSFMADAISVLNSSKAVFRAEKLDKKQSYATLKSMTAAVLATVDPLALVKDSLTHTFEPSVKAELDTYFAAIGKNKRAQAAHDRDQKKYDALVARGKTPDWAVAAAAITDLDMVKGNIVHLIERLVAHYEVLLTKKGERDFEAETVAAIDYLKTNASGVVAKVTHRIAKDRAIKLMTEVGIAEPHKRYNQYPFEFSGGMRQRIVIAIALAANPDILICDEPTTALDVTIQSQILELINKLKVERQLSVIFITHDLGVVANMADRVAVMYAGKIVEYGTVEDVFYEAAHPYTWALLSSMPDLDTNEKLEAIPGTPPNMIYPPVGDAFAARNKYAMQIDFEKQPPMFQISETHHAATWLLHPDAPKVERPKIIRDRIARMKEKRGEANE